MSTEPSIQLHRRSSCSFTCSDIGALADLLWQEHGFVPLHIRSRHEYARMKRSDALLVLYWSGSVVCQGAGAQQAIELLEGLEVGR